MIESWTIKKLIDWTTEYFKKFNIENPHLDAEILLSHSLKIPRIQLYIQFERTLTPEELAEYKKLIQRRAKREPIAYIIGYKQFMSLDFAVNSSVLIPRPETETLVESAVEKIKELDNPIIADIGTGSGAIAVSVAKYAPNAKVYATDLSENAIKVAQENARKHGVKDRCKFFAGNLFEPLEDKFDIIISNPPYIKSDEINGLQPEISKFEPRTALDGGKDGIDYYRKIINEASKYLNKPGFLMLEIGQNQEKDIKKIIESALGKVEIKFIKDLSGIERVIQCRLMP